MKTERLAGILIFVIFTIGIFACAQPSSRDHPPQEFCGNNQTYELSFLGRALVASSAMQASDNLTNCQRFLQRVNAHETTREEEVAFINSELFLWLKINRSTQYIKEECKPRTECCGK